MLLFYYYCIYYSMRYKAELGEKCLVNLFIFKICEYFFNTVESVILVYK